MVDFSRLIKHFATPSVCLSQSDVVRLGRVQQIISSHLDHKWEALQLSAIESRDPILYTYGSDGWGATVPESLMPNICGHRVFRLGMVRCEFLLERAILKSIDRTGEVRSAIKMKAPRSMDNGKLCFNIYTAAMEFSPILKPQCPGNILMNVYLQDGLHAAGFGKHMTATHELHWDLNIDDLDPAECYEASQLDWTFFIKCVGHVTSNALKWGLSAVLVDGLNDEVTMAIRSLRNSSKEFFKIIDKFLYHRMRYHPTTDELQRAEFWTALGVDANILDELLLVDPRWDVQNQILYVSSALQDDSDCMNRVASLLTYFIRWREFSATRWAGVGPSHRHLLASIAIGIDFMVPLIYDTENTSTFLFD
jgi:hypothetical protein